MQISHNHVVAFHFTLTNAQGERIDSSQGQSPFLYLHGHDNLIAGLEQALEGHRAGDHFTAVVPPEQAYGEVDATLIQTLPREMLPADTALDVGMSLQADTEGGDVSLRVTAFTAQTITVDANHPLAGQTLHFNIEVYDVRAASAAEIAQGYPEA